MTVKRLFELSAIAEHPSFDEMDYAVPMNPNGSYPHNGRAVSIYSKGRKFEIMPHSTLAEIALAMGDYEIWEVNDLFGCLRSSSRDIDSIASFMRKHEVFVNTIKFLRRDKESQSTETQTNKENE